MGELGSIRGPKVVHGDEFINNAANYIDKSDQTKCVKVLMGGVMTDCGTEPEIIANVDGNLNNQKKKKPRKEFY